MYSAGSGEASTEHGKDKFNIVHFLCNYSISTILNTNLSHNVYLFLRHVRPQFLAIFVEFVVLLMCAVYMSMYLVTVCIYD